MIRKFGWVAPIVLFWSICRERNRAVFDEGGALNPKDEESFCLCSVVLDKCSV